MSNSVSTIQPDDLNTSRAICIGEMSSSLTYLLETELSKMANHISHINYLLENSQINLSEIKKEISELNLSIEKIYATARELKVFSNHNGHEIAQKTNLKKLIENALELEKDRFRSHGIKIKSSIEESLFINAKESQLSQIILSALNSAYNNVHQERDAWVQITARNCDQNIYIEFSDSKNAKTIENLKLFKILEFIANENNGTFIFDPTSKQSIYRVILPTFIDS